MRGSRSIIIIVDLDQLHMGCCRVTVSVESVTIGGVAFYHGTLYIVHHGLPEIRTQEILVAALTGVYLDSHLARQFLAQELIHLQNLAGGDFSGKVNL